MSNLALGPPPPDHPHYATYMAAFKAKLSQISSENLTPETADDPLIKPGKLQDLLGKIDNLEKLDGDVETLMGEVIEDFLEQIAEFGCKLAKHRGSEVLDVADVQIPLELKWDVKVPGFGEEPKEKRKSGVSKVHGQRVQAVRSAISDEGPASGRGRKKKR